MADAYTDALADLADPANPTQALSRIFAEVLPVDGASVSALGTVLGTETLSATDEQAARIDEVQFDLGEGPCWDAWRSAIPVIEQAVRSSTRWPAFVAAIRSEPVTSLYAFPVSVGTLRFGAVDLYSQERLEMKPAELRQATLMADVVGRRLLQDALDAAADDTDDNPHSRRVIHQATGMVLAQLDLPPEEAQLIIQGHAFATSRSMMGVAQDITAGALAFVRTPTGIEVKQ